MILAVLAYLLVSFLGWLAVVKYFTIPHYNCEEGFDLTWCGCFWMAVVALVPIIGQAAFNLFWFWVLRQKIKRRPLIRWPQIRFPRCSLPKCPVAIKGKRRTV